MKGVYSGKTSSGQDFLIRYPIMEDLNSMLSYMNTLSKEQTFIRFQGEQLTLEEEQTYLTEYLKKIYENKAVKLLAFVDDNLVGIADIELQPKVEKHVGLFGITIAQNFRGEGIGAKLMELTIDEAIKNLPGLRIIVLSVFENNEVAIKLYKKMGFVEYGLLPNGVKHKNQFVNHIYMYKKVD